MSVSVCTRRRAVQALIGFSAAGSGRAGDHAPLSELANVMEMLAAARRKLPEGAYSAIAGADRAALERITFRPRMMVNVSNLDLSSELLGQQLAAPILVGPMARLQDYHPDGELALVRGAGAARTPVIVSSRSSRKLSEIAAEAKSPLWFQLYPDTGATGLIASAQRALEQGCKAICLTVGAPAESAGSAASAIDWKVVSELKKGIGSPLALKGIMDPEEGRIAVSIGVDAIVVSNHGGIFGTGFADPIEMLPPVVDAVAGRIPVLVDGSFRRGTDILKALAFGARAVLLGRPPVWGLAAYGADGVQKVLEMLRTELARNMALCGKPDLRSLDRTLVKVHRR